ncbi:MAG: hypothetical protein ACI4Q3_06205 [Kiritimatiellia bacterium]
MARAADNEEKIAMTAEEKAFIETFTKKYCRPHAVVMAERLTAFVTARRMALLTQAPADFRLAAGEATPVTGVRSPDEKITFTFASESEDRAWKALLTIPAGATAETMVPVDVSVGAAPAEGLFKIAGCSLPLAEGRAEIPFGLFLAGIKDADVMLISADGASHPGRLQFF